jgi:hypothetical protein
MIDDACFMHISNAHLQSMNWSDTTKSFTRDNIWDPAQLTVCGIAVVVGLACAITRWITRARDHNTSAPPSTQQLHPVSIPFTDKEYRYDAYTAWLRGGIFFSVCFVISWITGVLDATFFHPIWPLQMDNISLFILFTLTSFVTVLIGYWIIWPIGTVSYGRKWSWYCVLFGIVDGLSESQLFLCIWSAVEHIGLPRYGTGLITFVLQGGFKANWDQRYWNVYVAPAHNIEEWNVRKVLLVHIPNVLVTFSFFITYGNATLYCATQTLALIGSTSAMRFPSPLSNYINPPLDSQVVRHVDKGSALLWRDNHWEEQSCPEEEEETKILYST